MYLFKKILKVLCHIFPNFRFWVGYRSKNILERWYSIRWKSWPFYDLVKTREYIVNKNKWTRKKFDKNRACFQKRERKYHNYFIKSKIVEQNNNSRMPISQFFVSSNNIRETGLEGNKVIWLQNLFVLEMALFVLDFVVFKYCYGAFLTLFIQYNTTTPKRETRVQYPRHL